MKKQLLSLILALVMCLGLSNPAFALTVEEGCSAFEINMDVTRVSKNDTIYEEYSEADGVGREDSTYYDSMKPGSPITVKNVNTDPDVIVYVYFTRYSFITQPQTIYNFVEDDSPEGFEEVEETIQNVYFGSDACFALTDRNDHEYYQPEDYTAAGTGLYWMNMGFASFGASTAEMSMKCLHSGESVTVTLPQTGGADVIYRLSVVAYYPSLDDGVQNCYFRSWDDIKLEDTPPTAPAPTSTTAFTDVAPTAYYAAPVAWAVANNVTAGTSATAFSPANPCTQQQILTFLYRAQRNMGGTPAPASAQDLTDALNWARENGMIDDSFDPNATCTRATAVNYIWQAMGKSEAAASSFNDVSASASYAAAVNWAVANGVTSGTGNGSFSPDRACDRGTIMTFLYRAYVN